MIVARLPVVAAVLAGCALAAGCGGEEPRAPAPTRTAAPTAQGETAEPRPHTFDLAAARGRATYCVIRSFSAPERPAVTAFNARHRGDGLEARFRPVTSARQIARLLGNGCDLAHVHMAVIAQLAYAGLIEDLTDYVGQRAPEFMRAPLEAVRWKESYWAVPRSVEATLLYYTTGEGPPATWQELYERAAGNDGLVYAGAADEALTIHFLELAYAAGANVISRDGEHSEIDSPPARQALKLMVKGYQDEAVLPEVRSYSEEDAIVAFARGQATYMLGWPWAAKTLSEPHPVSGYVFDGWDVNELPAFEGGRASGVLVGSAVVVARDARDHDAALALADYLTSVGALNRAVRRHRLAPPLADPWKYPHLIERLPAAYEHHRAIEQARPLPVTPAAPAILLAIQHSVHAALAGRLSPEQALRAADRAIDGALARFRELEGEPS
jgi:multiple sugar transport system substrate-binding protein